MGSRSLEYGHNTTARTAAARAREDLNSKLLSRDIMKERDEHFYFAMTIFEVEGALFKLPRRPFEEQSEVFQAMFLLPPGTHTQVEGLTDEMPLRLEGVTKTDFKAFLKVLFPPSFGEDMQLGTDEWLSVLSLSSMWGFTKIRSTAIDKLQTVDMDLVMKIELAHKFDIREWLFSSYLSLGKREEPLSTNEAARLGWDFAIKMASVREHLLRDKIAHPNAYNRRFMPGRGESPRGPAPSAAGGSGSRAGSAFSRMRGPALFASPFPGDTEDEDDFVLAKAIQEVFGIRGETNPDYHTTIGSDGLYGITADPDGFLGL